MEWFCGGQDITEEQSAGLEQESELRAKLVAIGQDIRHVLQKYEC